MTPKLRYLLAAGLFALPVDQLTKAWVAVNVPTGSVMDRITVVEDFFYITHARNPGAAFGLLVDWPWAWRITLFVTVAAVAVLVVISFFRSLAPGDRFNAFALGLVMGGALGNLIDRLTRGEVIDFLHFRLWGDRSWPDFNLADSFLVVGVAALMLELLATEAESRASGEAERNDADA
jgi:signal peptidase II